MIAEKPDWVRHEGMQIFSIDIQSGGIRFALGGGDHKMREGSKTMVFTENQEALVKNSWEIMKQDVPELSLRFFQTIFEIAPAARSLFSFLKDTDDDEISANDPRVKAHAVVVFKMTRKAAVQLRKTGGVEITEKTLKSLGSVHLKKGITDPQFEVVGEALLRTIKGAVGEEWNDELRIAWTEAYNQLAEVIKAAIKDEAAGLD